MLDLADFGTKFRLTDPGYASWAWPVATVIEYYLSALVQFA